MKHLLAALFLAIAAAALGVRDWNDRPLAYGTAAVFDEEGSLVALTYIFGGETLYGLPWRPGYVLRVAWGIASPREIAAGQVIWIYDSAVLRDIVELGEPTGGKIRTWAYPVTVVVKEAGGRPAAGCYARVIDAATRGRWVDVFTSTASDGSIRLYQAPATDYLVNIYCGGYLTASTKFSIQRGAPSTAWNYEITIDYITSVRVENAP